MADLKSREYLADFIHSRQTFLTVGLDSDVAKLPACVRGDVLSFNKAIIDATKDYCISYKINFAFYETLGKAGWDILEKTIQHIPETHFIIADAKRGDIGNTSEMYAKAVFDHLGCDAITVNPYMGKDSVTPFYREGKWVIILGLTSNTGSQDFQKTVLADGKAMYEHVMQTTASWGNIHNTMYVIGATQGEEMQIIRDHFPEHFFLVPGVGAQGGDLHSTCRHGANRDGGLLINASRSILYAGSDNDFAEAASKEAMRLTTEMRAYIHS